MRLRTDEARSDGEAHADSCGSVQRLSVNGGGSAGAYRVVRAGVPIRMPPGMKADLSPGTVFLLRATDAISRTDSTLRMAVGPNQRQ